MADPGQSPAERPPDFRVTIEESVAGLVDANVFSKTYQWITALLFNFFVAAVGWVLEGAAKIAGIVALVLVRGEDKAQPAFGQLAAIAVEDVFGVKVDAAAMNDRGNRGKRTAAANAIGRAVLESLTDGGGGASGAALAPSAAGAEKYISTVTQMALEGWLEGWIVEAVSLGQLETFGELDDIMAQVLGLGRMSRRVVGPLLTARVITPFQWQVNKTYRPELLSAGEVARQLFRGRMTKVQAVEELARQGFSDERIDALLNGQQKFFSAGDVRMFVDRAHWNFDRGLQHLRDQGFSEGAAADTLRLEGLRRVEQLESAQATAIITAYVDRRLTKTEFLGLLHDAIESPTERALLELLADTRLAVNYKPLSPSEARACVKAGILAVVDYREALRSDGYNEEAVLALELLLRQELDEQRSIDQHRAEMEAQRAAEQAAKDAAAVARKAAIEADRALARRGDESDLERAAVRGLVPFARVEALYRARYDGDTVAILVDLLEDARADYVAQQQAAADAKLRAGRRALDVGTLEAAYLAGVLTKDRLESHPTFQSFSASDRAILFADFERRKREQDAAARIKADATAAASRKGIDLGRFERLVRLGARTFAQYDQQLAALGFTEGARADMRELLDREIAADAAARELRGANEPALRAKGLSLEQFRRAVVLGTKTDVQFNAFLAQQGFTDDARAVLLADVRATVADADAARLRRDQPIPDRAAPALSLARVAEAARLGLLTPATYAARLRRDGYSEEDLAIEMELLLLEIGDVQAARAKRDALEAVTATPTLSLAQVERAVKARTATIADYRGAAAQLGYSVDDTALLVTTLEAELGTRDEARRRRDEIDAELKPRNLSIAQLEATVKGGLKSVADFLADVQALGYSPEDAELLAVLLVDELEAAEAA